MEDQRKMLPELPGEAQPDELAIYQMVVNYLLNLSEDYPEPLNLLEYCGVPFSAIGGIQAITGHQKNGKTWLLTQFMAALLGSDKENVQMKLPGLRLREGVVENPTVLYCDTEMEKLYTAKVVRRVHWLCGWDMKENNDRLHTLWLRTVDDPAEKYKIIQTAIEIFKPTVVFIDGIRDLVHDFNDLKESMPLILNLMKTATEHNCCIWNVLHKNPGDAQADSKMRGHLGTELGNKVTDTFESIKKKSENGVVTFQVRQIDARGKDVPDWKYQICDDAGDLGIPRILTPAEVMPKSDTAEQIRKWLTDGQRDIEWPATAGEVKSIFKIRGGVTNNDQLQADFTIAKNRRFVTPQAKEASQKYPKYILNDEEILPF